MPDLIVAGHLANNARAVALTGNIGPHLLGLMHVRVGADTYLVTRVWPSHDGITGLPDLRSPTWFAELAGERRLPEFGSGMCASR